MDNSLDVMRALDKLFAWLTIHLPETVESLNPPATDKELTHAENILSIKFPADVKQLYLRHNGQNEKLSSALLNGAPVSAENINLWRVIPGLFFGLEFVSLDKMIEEWQTCASVPGGPHGSLEEMNAISSSNRPGFIMPVHTNKKWIPLTAGPDHLGLDFDPGPKGINGQVINFGRDEHIKFVIASSFGEFVEWYVKELESGNFKIEEWTGSGFGREFTIKTPDNQHFLDAAKMLFE